VTFILSERDQCDESRRNERNYQAQMHMNFARRIGDTTAAPMFKAEGESSQSDHVSFNEPSGLTQGAERQAEAVSDDRDNDANPSHLQVARTRKSDPIMPTSRTESENLISSEVPRILVPPR
jgi:hypothetical protein